MALFCNIISIICILLYFLTHKIWFSMFFVCLFLFSSDWFTTLTFGCFNTYKDIFKWNGQQPNVYLCRVWYDKMKFKIEWSVWVWLWVLCLYLLCWSWYGFGFGFGQTKIIFSMFILMVFFFIQYSIVELCQQQKNDGEKQLMSGWVSELVNRVYE